MPKKLHASLIRERFYIENDTYDYVPVECTTIDENSFLISLFLDGSITETSTCGTGPNGNYSGSQRKTDFDDFQRSIYSGYKKQHGLTMLSVMNSNGIHFLFGPCSMRENDRWLVNESNLNIFLRDLQNNTPSLGGRLFAAYGDNTFLNAECIRRSHVGDDMNPLPPILNLQNNGMKAVRITIENGFGEMANLFKICNNFCEFKLHEESSHAKEQLVVCYFLSNILNTFNGSQIQGHETFFCSGQSFEEYVELGDE